ncbi:MAG: hypothetical protein L6W00_11145 [Lentisphaeria bacterium]|nr:MAG: hypothetical protein L6W00_11145 [Lentisphaeria bacterium]
MLPITRSNRPLSAELSARARRLSPPGKSSFPPAGFRNHQHLQIDFQLAVECFDFRDDAIDQIEFRQRGDQRGISETAARSSGSATVPGSTPPRLTAAAVESARYFFRILRQFTVLAA